MRGPRESIVFDPALLWLHIVPQILVAVALLTGGAFFWLRSPRTPLVHALTLLVLFRGHLSLVAAIAWLPDTPDMTLRLWPVFDLAVVAASFAVLLFLMSHHFSPQRMDGLLSSIIGGGALLAAALVVMPSLFWGDAGEIGAFAFLDGLRTALGGAIGWLLLRRFVRGDPEDAPRLPRRMTYLLSLAFVLPSVHWAMTDLLYISTLGIPAVDLAASVDHRGRSLGAGFLLLAGWELTAAFRVGGATREWAARYLLVALMPALTSVLLLDLYVFGLVGGDLLGLAVASLFDCIWIAALPLSIAWAVAPAALRRRVRQRSPLAAATPLTIDP